MAHGSLVVAGGLQGVDLVAAWHVGPWFPRQGFNPRPLHYPANLESAGPPGSPSKQSCAEVILELVIILGMKKQKDSDLPKVTHLGTGRKNNLGLLLSTSG